MYWIVKLAKRTVLYLALNPNNLDVHVELLTLNTDPNTLNTNQVCNGQNIHVSKLRCTVPKLDFHFEIGLQFQNCIPICAAQFQNCINYLQIVRSINIPNFTHDMTCLAAGCVNSLCCSILFSVLPNLCAPCFVKCVAIVLGLCWVLDAKSKIEVCFSAFSVYYFSVLPE